MTLTLRSIGMVRTPYGETGQIPKGPDARHDAEGTLEIGPEFEAGLTDIEGFSHLFIVWAFDRAEGYDLLDGTPILDIKPYLSSVPADALKRGWLDEAEARRAGGASRQS